MFKDYFGRIDFCRFMYRGMICYYLKGYEFILVLLILIYKSVKYSFYSFVGFFNYVV